MEQFQSSLYAVKTITAAVAMMIAFHCYYYIVDSCQLLNLINQESITGFKFQLHCVPYILLQNVMNLKYFATRITSCNCRRINTEIWLSSPDKQHHCLIIAKSFVCISVLFQFSTIITNVLVNSTVCRSDEMDERNKESKKEEQFKLIRGSGSAIQINMY